MYLLAAFDEWVIGLTGKIAGRSVLLDTLMIKATALHSVKLVPLMAVLVGLWYSGDRRARTGATLAVISMLAAIGLSRAIQDILPIRVRPIHSGNPEFVMPIGSDQRILEHWSSFPSDHAALVFALATMIWLCSSRRLGILCYAWGILFDCIPRIYAGYHYTSDVLGGALIGVFVALLAKRFAPDGKLANGVEWLAFRSPALFAAAQFVLLFELATMFEDIRTVSTHLVQLARG